MQDSHAEIQWMLAVQNGDKQAFNNILDRYEKPVINFAYGFLHDRQAAEDVAQDVFLEIYRRAPHYKPTGKLSTWIFTIAAHRCLNIRRRKKFFFLSEPEPAEVPEAREPAPHERLEKIELQETIRLALLSLPENQRMAVLLAKFEEMPLDEVARVLNISVGAVKQLLFRAKRALKERLRPYL